MGYKVSDFFELINGYAFKSSEFKEEGIPVLKIKNIKAGRLILDDCDYVDKEYLIKKSDKVTKLNDLLVTMTGNRHDGSPETWVGKVAWWGNEKSYLINQRVGILRVKPEVKINSRFIAYQLSGLEMQKHFISIATSSGGQANLSPSQILESKIWVPSLKVQNNISNFIGNIEDKIETNNKLVNLLNQISKELFNRYFIDFEFPNEQGLPYRSSGGEMVESELGEIPKNWRIGTIEDHLYLHYGKALTKKDRVEGDIPVYGSGGVTGSHNKAIVKGPGIILGRKGSIGTLYYEMKDFYPIDTVFYVESKKHSLNYLLNLLKTYDFTKSNNDSAVPGLNRNLVYNTKTLIPLDSIVKKYEEVIAPINLMIFDLKEENVKLEKLRDNLLPKLLSGEIEIPDESVVES